MPESREIQTIDSKGRLDLGAALASTRVIVEEVPGGVLVKPIDEHEVWLWENETALDSVMEGVEQAGAGQLSDGPENPSMPEEIETDQRASAYSALAGDEERSAAIDDSALYSARHGLA